MLRGRVVILSILRILLTLALAILMHTGIGAFKRARELKLVACQILIVFINVIAIAVWIYFN